MQRFTHRETDRHSYYGISVEGRHTPGANSDAFTIFRNPSPSISFLGVVADGVTGNNVDRKILAGQFVAQRIVEIFPRILTDFDKDSVRESKTTPDFLEALPSIIYKTNLEITRPFAEQFSQLTLSNQRELYGASTIAGIIETAKDFILFSAGDSSVFALDHNYEFIEETVFDMHRDQFGRLTSAIAVYNEKGKFVPYYPEHIGVKSLQKSDEIHRIISCTDGLTPAGSTFELAYYLTYANRKRPSELAHEAFAYAKVIEDADSMIPDDKTIIVLKG